MTIYATFFLSAAVFGLLILLTPVISALLLGQQLIIVYATPLLGLALSTSFLLILRRRVPDYFLLPLAFLILILIFVLFFKLVLIQEIFNSQLLAEGRLSESLVLENLSGSYLPAHRAAVTAVLILPFAAYGVFLLTAMSSINRVLVYKTEMIGALVGTSAVAISLEQLGFQWALFVIVCFCIAACLWLCRSNISRLVIVSVLVTAVGLIFLQKNWLEPQRNLHLISRDFKMVNKIKLIDESWTTFAKVQTLQLEAQGRLRQVIILGEGTGLARLRTHDGAIMERETRLTRIVSTLAPAARSISVLFAGAGAELIDLNQMYQGQARILGIEMNSKVLAQAFYNPSSEFLSVSQRAPLELRRGEARSFLNNENTTFDVLLFSWSGATVAHYSGALVHTTQNAFTLEAMQAAVSKVNPEGLLVIAGAGKVNLLISLKELERQGVLSVPLQDSVTLISRSDELPAGWKKTWDNMILVWKNGKLSENEIARLKLSLKEGLAVVHSPFESQLPEVKDLIMAKETAPVIEKLRLVSGVYFDLFTDDRPYIYSDEKPSSPFQSSFWQPGFAALRSFKILGSPLATFIVGIMIALSILVSRHFKSLRASTYSLGITSFLVGWIGVAFQILILFRFISFFENPTLALIVGVGGGFLGSYLGAKLIFKCPPFAQALAVGISSTLYILFLQMLPLEILLPSYIFISIGWGTIFPHLLKLTNSSPKVLIWVFSLDAWGAVCATLFIPILLQNQGFLYTERFSLAILLFTLLFFVTSINPKSTV